MTYKVLNCPAYNNTPNMYDEIYGYCDNEHDIDLNKCMCENNPDCVIKQVIDKCKKHNNTYPIWEILDMFDIQEVRE